MTKRLTAAALYASNQCRELFKQAWDIFPKYNTRQSDEAADWIFDRLLPVEEELPQEQKDELFEMIYAGLT